MQIEPNIPGKKVLALVAAIALFCAACSAGPEMPEVPYFESLGFENALPIVRDQMETAYAAWQQQPRDPGSNGRLGMHLSAYGKSTAAEILYRRAHALAPKEFRWTYYLAFTLMDKGEPAEAMQMFRDALALDPGHPEARIQLAGLLFDQNVLTETQRLYESITEELPNRVEGWLGSGRILLRNGDNAAAIKMLEKARDVGPNFGEIYFALGTAYLNIGDEESASKAFDLHKRFAGSKIRSADPLLVEAAELNISDTPHMARARFYGQRAQYAEAEESYRLALAANPMNNDAWTGLLSVQAEAGERDAATKTYQDAIAAGAQSAALSTAYGQSLSYSGLTDLALQAFGDALAIDAENGEAHAGLGEVQFLLGNYEESIAHYQQAIRLSPDDRLLEYSLAVSMRKGGRNAEAVELLEGLLEDRSTNKALILKELALSYREMGQPDRALAALERGRKLAWQSSDIRLTDEIDAILGAMSQAQGGLDTP